MALLPISLVVAYSLWYYFLGHQMSHVINGRTPSRVGEEFFVSFLGEEPGGTTARQLSLVLATNVPIDCRCRESSWNCPLDLLWLCIPMVFSISAFCHRLYRTVHPRKDRNGIGVS